MKKFDTITEAGLALIGETRRADNAIRTLFKSYNVLIGNQPHRLTVFQNVKDWFAFDHLSGKEICSVPKNLAVINH